MPIARLLTLSHALKTSRSQPWLVPRRFVASAATPSISPILLAHARAKAAEHGELSKKLADGFDNSIAVRLGELAPAAKAIQEWDEATESVNELRNLLSDETTDLELRSLAAEEIESTSTQLDTLASQLKATLVPIHPFAHLPCLLELRPGAGGSEAGLFASDLLTMYTSFCKRHNLRVSVLKLEDAANSSGEATKEIQEAVLEIESEGAYGILSCEAGVHRVQRVPATETKGRTHTSAVSVLILPNFGDENGNSGNLDFNDPNSDYYIDAKDVRTDVMRARGAGGQHVNTTDSAVRLTHEPTGTVVACQDGRSQHKNREKAWKILRARIAQARREAREEEMAALRRGVIGVARMGRGDKVRTYNWGQNRVTDHRSGESRMDLAGVLEGGEVLDGIMEGVRAWVVERELEGLVLAAEVGNGKEGLGKKGSGGGNGKDGGKR
ncbi:hypothetical protein MMC25_001333 [Agyrium rufum]|nr:hypothetical protein [Agyrium rufum]